MSTMRLITMPQSRTRWEEQLEEEALRRAEMHQVVTLVRVMVSDGLLHYVVGEHSIPTLRIPL